jgi:alkylation response protein AidB-like acyl-CoA dehydrogenase
MPDVDFDFSPEQHALRDAVRSTLAAEAPRSYVDAMADDERGLTDEFWRVVVDQGWPALLVPEEHGGLGLGLVDMVVVMEETGRLPLPGPVWSSGGLATLAALRLGATDLLPDLASGARRGTVAIDEVGTSGDPLAGLRTRATRSGDGWLLDGVKPAVPDGATADWVVVVAADESGVGAYLVEGSEVAAVPGMDPTRKLGRLELAATPARRLSPDGDQTALLRRVVDDAAVLLCAELVGVCDAAVAMSQEYAKTRVQFGRPIGSFQAIKHIAADQVKDTTLARVGVHWAAWASDTDAPEREQAAAMAKSWAPEAAIRVTGDTIQIHGGVGFTWACGAHYLYKRAKANDLLLGRQGWNRARVADLVLGPVA